MEPFKDYTVEAVKKLKETKELLSNFGTVVKVPGGYSLKKSIRSRPSNRQLDRYIDTVIAQLAENDVVSVSNGAMIYDDHVVISFYPPKGVSW